MNNFRKTFPVILIALGVCFPAQAQTKTRHYPLLNLIAGIQQRAEPLVYVSEQNWDVNVFVVGRNIAVLNAESFRAANPFIAFETVEDFRTDVFFDRLEKRDARWTELRGYLEANLTQIKIFKVGSIRRDIYAVGLFQGHIVGIRTFGIET